MAVAERIGYVELADDDPGEGGLSFVFRRFARATFVAPPSQLPHRHNYQEIIAVQAGRAWHTIDGEPREQRPGTLALIAKGQVHRFERAEELTGHVVRFTDDFLPAGFLSASWDYRATLFNHLGLTHALALGPADARDLGGLLGLIEHEWRHDDAQRQSALRHLVAALLIRIERVARSGLRIGDEQGDGYRLYHDFMALLDRDFAARHDVRHYATALGIAPDALSQALGRVVGRTTKQIIAERLTIEAKRHLRYTDGSVKEIAAALGYRDPFQFSRAFKRLTGAAPLAYRAACRKMT